VIQIPRGKTTALISALSKIVKILRLDPNVLQQLSEIFQSRKIHISYLLMMDFPNMKQTGIFEIIIYNVNYPMER